MTFEQAQTILAEAGQPHVLDGFKVLSAEQQVSLLDQIASVDWQELVGLVESHVKHRPVAEVPSEMKPCPWMPNKPAAGLEATYAQARETGEALIAAGKVAAFTVAGGQGSRLGWNGPKGTFPSTPIRKLPLFGCMAEYLVKTELKYGLAAGSLPWYIMTSPLNHEDTVAYFAAHDNFGLQADQLMFFSQAMMPATDAVTGKVLMAAQGELALAPNGHGGSLKALYTSGAIADMQKRGIEQIAYTQIDNPICKVVDPLFLGFHVQAGAEMSNKMLAKQYPLEKMGVFCMVDGKMTVIEYSNFPDALAHQTESDGALTYSCGNIAMHVLRVSFVARINTQEGGFALPWNRADKKITFFDGENTIKPETPNAVKLETFVFDALPMAANAIIFEADRIEEFAPIKNADAAGADWTDAKAVKDCPASSCGLQAERNARWLESLGVAFPRTKAGKPAALVEIPGLVAIEPADLDVSNLPPIEAGDVICLDAGPVECAS